MASFFEDLWQSVFTAGPTTSLVLATNIAFAALQLVLFALLVATYSIHFLVLSLLCGGLWCAINWFVSEIIVVHAEMDEKRRRDGEQSGSEQEGNGVDSVGGPSQTLSRASDGQSTSAAKQEETLSAKASDISPPTVKDVLRKRARGMGESMDLTDSEWEKVDKEL